jgi:hypothetical protein
MRPLLLRSTAIVALVSLLIASGCYSYLPAPAGPIKPESTMRVYLSTNGSNDLTRSVGPDVVSLDGYVIGQSDTTLELSVTSLQRQNRDADRWQGERVVIPRTYVDRIAVREFDRTRTVVAALVAIGGLLIARSLVTGAGGSVAGTPAGGTGAGQ